MRLAQALCLLASVAAGCARPAPTAADAKLSTLRIGISTGRMSLSAPEAGLVQVRQNFSIESLASFDDDGRPRASVAEGWAVSPDRKLLTIRLRPNVKYQDGTSVTAGDIAAILQRTLPRNMSTAFEDVDTVSVASPRAVDIRFRRPTGFSLELLEVPVQKPGTPALGTGPYIAVPNTNNELRANENYYLGRPFIDRIAIQNYPSFRSAWADLLRGNNDMLYEVGVDALDSLQDAKGVAHVFTFLKRYQYMLVFNGDRPALGPRTVRQALNLAIDRPALVRDALSGRGQASTGPVWPHHWAMARSDIPKATFDPVRAAALLRSSRTPLQFKCLVLADHERLALVVKRQLEAVSVDMAVEEVTADQLLTRLGRRDFDAFLVDAVSGPTIYRLYRFWHSGNKLIPTDLGNSTFDAALDQVRHATSDQEYRQGVFAVQRAALEDPPAIFLAWSEGARAVSSRFEVPTDSSRPDPIGTLRLWKPTNAQTVAGRN